MLSRVLARPWAWWLNKVPLSVTLVLLLVDGGVLGPSQTASLVLVMLIVSAVGNHGYALNDLFDMDEDRRTGRPNFAQAVGRRRTAGVIAASALLALTLAWIAAGPWGCALALAALSLSLAYSIPPVRIKERKWLGVLADALAAHVFPAALALMTVRHLHAAQPSPLAAGCILAWSAAAGLRGILSHQLHTALRDLKGGLATVVHDIGRAPLERFVVFGLLPIEAGGFIGAVALSPTGPVLWAFGALYLACEAYRTLNRRFVVRACWRRSSTRCCSAST
jgi:4-hydroxybenzoate polyprenyltransferase